MEFKISIKLAFLVLIISTISCGDDFLDRTPFSGYTTENFYENETQMQDAANGLYPAVRNLHTGVLWQIGDFRTDNTTFQFNPSDRGAQAQESVDYYLAESNLGLFGSIWSTAYNTISKCHFILESIDDVTFTDPEKKTQILAETRFMRGYMYSLLTKYYGPVPLVDRVILTEEESSSIRRSPVDDIYNQLILPDLEFAIENLPNKHNNANAGRASADAARMVLANAHFARRDYTAALPFLKEIVESNRYSLLPNYKDVFSPNDNFNDEIIWNVQFNSSLGQGAGFMINWLPTSGTDLTQGIDLASNNLGKNIPTQDMMRAYEQGDRRMEASVGIYVNGSGDSIPYINKYLFPPLGGTGSDLDLPIYRLADANLMYAEALMETAGGLPDEVFFILNDLRVRAGLGALFPGNPIPELNIDSPDKLLEAVRHERRVELAFEMKRYDDLVRWETLEETMRAHGEEMKALQGFLSEFPSAYTNIPSLLPIPFGQILLWGYEQNPGW